MNKHEYCFFNYGQSNFDFIKIYIFVLKLLIYYIYD